MRQRMHVKVLWPSFRWRQCTLDNTAARAQSCTIRATLVQIFCEYGKEKNKSRYLCKSAKHHGLSI